MEQYRKLEAGLTRHQRERFEGGDKEQLVLALLAMMAPGPSPEATKETEVAAHKRVSPTGRKPLPENLPRIGGAGRIAEGPERARGSPSIQQRSVRRS